MEKQLVSSWLDMFRDTITCSSCRGHFTDLLARYRLQFPNMLQSRHDFIIFTFRAHNNVNKRLNKPVYSTVEECVATLRNNVRNRTAKDYRDSYLNHIVRHWRSYQDITGISSVRKINEMRRIESEYFLSRDTNFATDVRADVVVLPQLNASSEVQIPRPALPNSSGVAGFRLTSRGFRLRM
jgi:hypothetical protein